jgi:hypothetical protein
MEKEPETDEEFNAQKIQIGDDLKKRQANSHMLEPEMERLLNEQFCCGEKMFVECMSLSPYRETGGIAICLKCGNFIQISGGELDEDEIDEYRERKD